MDEVIGEKIANGFAGVTPGPGCRTTPLPGFTCSRTITVINPNTDQITVTINQTTLGISATLYTLITNY